MVRTKVFVGNLSFQTKEAELASEFAVAGKVISANIITRGPRSLGYGFVELDSEEDAQNAVKLLNKKEINGRPVNVEIAKPQDETKERKPRPPKPEGENGGPRRRPRRRGLRKKGGEEGTEHAEETEKEGKREEGGEQERVRRRPRNRRPRRPTGANVGERRRVPNEEKVESKTTLFVANLPFSLDDAAFAKIVTDLSLKLKAAHVVKKRNGRSKGYGFIEFDTHDDQQKALSALNQKVIDSRELSVKVALTELKSEQPEEQKETKATPATAPAPAEKKTSPPAAEKKASPPAAEKKTVPPAAEKKTAPPAAEKKVTPPAEKKAATTEKKTTPPAEKKPQESKAAPEKKPAAEKPAQDKKEEKKEEKK